MRALLLAGLLTFALGASPPPDDPAEAQRDVRLEVALPAPGQRAAQPPAVSSTGVLSDARVVDLLMHGFPARLHYRLELWSASGWFNDLEDQIEWDVIVRFSAMTKHFDAVRVDRDGAKPMGSFELLSEVTQAVEGPYKPKMQPPSGRSRYYYKLRLDVEMMSTNDLDEVERWLRGELSPAVRGKRNPASAITRGIRALVVGLLGEENRRYEVRTRTFVPNE